MDNWRKWSPPIAPIHLLDNVHLTHCPHLWATMQSIVCAVIIRCIVCLEENTARECMWTWTHLLYIRESPAQISMEIHRLFNNLSIWKETSITFLRMIKSMDKALSTRCEVWVVVQVILLFFYIFFNSHILLKERVIYLWNMARGQIWLY